MNTKAQSPYLVGSSARLAITAIYENRLKHAQENLKFWNDQWCERPDGVAQAELDAAYRALGDIHREIARLNKPGTLVMANTAQT